MERPRPWRRHIVDRSDIELLTRVFYSKAMSDEKLFKYFLELRFGELEHHLPKICDYWDTKLFDAGSYREDTLNVHLRLDALHRLRADHFRRWIELWVSTIDELFVGPVAAKAKCIGAEMSCALYYRITGRNSHELEDMVLALTAHELLESVSRKEKS